MRTLLFLLTPALSLSPYVSSPGCVSWEPAPSQHREAKAPVLREPTVRRGDRQPGRGAGEVLGTRGISAGGGGPGEAWAAHRDRLPDEGES